MSFNKEFEQGAGNSSTGLGGNSTSSSRATPNQPYVNQ